MQEWRRRDRCRGSGGVAPEEELCNNSFSGGSVQRNEHNIEMGEIRYNIGYLCRRSQGAGLGPGLRTVLGLG